MILHDCTGNIPCMSHSLCHAIHKDNHKGGKLVILPKIIFIYLPSLSSLDLGCSKQPCIFITFHLQGDPHRHQDVLRFLLEQKCDVDAQVTDPRREIHQATVKQTLDATWGKIVE